MPKEFDLDTFAREALKRADEKARRQLLAKSISGTLVRYGQEINSVHTTTKPVDTHYGDLFVRRSQLDTGEELGIALSYGDSTYTVCKVVNGEIVDANGNLIVGEELESINKVLLKIEQVNAVREQIARARTQPQLY